MSNPEQPFSRPSSPQRIFVPPSRAPSRSSSIASPDSCIVICNLPLVYIRKNDNNVEKLPEENHLSFSNVVHSWMTTLRYLADRIMAQTGVQIIIQSPSSKVATDSLQDPAEPQSKFLGHIQKATMKATAAQPPPEYLESSVQTDLSLAVTLISNDKATLLRAYNSMIKSKDAHQIYQRIDIPLTLMANESILNVMKEKMEDIFNRFGGLLFEWVSEEASDIQSSPNSHPTSLLCNVIGNYESVMSASSDVAALFDSYLMAIDDTINPSYLSFDVPLKELFLLAGPLLQGLYSKHFVGTLSETSIHFYLPPSVQILKQPDEIITKRISFMASADKNTVLTIQQNILAQITRLQTNAQVVDLFAHSFNGIDAKDVIFKKTLVFSVEKALWLLYKRTRSLKKILFQEGVYAEFSQSLDSHWIMSLTLYTLQPEYITKCEKRILSMLDSIQSATVHILPQYVSTLLASDTWLKNLQSISKDYDVQIQCHSSVIHISGFVENLQKSLTTFFTSMITADFVCIPISQCIKNIHFCLEYSKDIRDFISGKKDGKLNKIMRDYVVNVYIEDAHNWSIVVFIDFFEDLDKRHYLCLDHLLQAVDSLQGELPAELSFYIPEVHHKRIIGHGGKNIQKIMKNYGVYVKFVNALEQSKQDHRALAFSRNGYDYSVDHSYAGTSYSGATHNIGGPSYIGSGYGSGSGPSSPVSGYRKMPNFASIDSDISDNVLVKTPAKNREALQNMKLALLEISSHLDLSVKPDHLKIPPWILLELDMKDLLHEMANSTLDTFKPDANHPELGIFKYPMNWFSCELLIIERMSKFPSIQRSIWRILNQRFQLPIVPSPPLSPRLYNHHPFMNGMEHAAPAKLTLFNSMNGTKLEEATLIQPRTPRAKLGRSHSLIEDKMDNVFKHFNSVLLGHPKGVHSALSSPSESFPFDASSHSERPQSLNLTIGTTNSAFSSSRAVGDRSGLTPISFTPHRMPLSADAFQNGAVNVLDYHMDIFNKKMRDLSAVSTEFEAHALKGSEPPQSIANVPKGKHAASKTKVNDGDVPATLPSDKNLNRFQSELIITSVAQWKTPIIAEQSL